MQAMHIVAPLFWISKTSLRLSPIKKKTSTITKATAKIPHLIMTTSLCFDPVHCRLATRASWRSALAANGTNKRSQIAVPIGGHFALGTKRHAFGAAPRANTPDIMLNDPHFHRRFDYGLTGKQRKFTDRIHAVNKHQNKENGRQDPQLMR